MTQYIKCLCYYLAKYSGLFIFARRIFRHKIRILCYHGFSYQDEHVFRPKLFISPALFSQRLAKIQNSRFNVITLDQACRQLAGGQPDEDSVVITIDDGWSGVKKFAAPLLTSYRFPSTLYLTTYYMQKRIQVVNLMVQYLLWKSTATNVDFSALGQSFNDYQDVNCHKPQLLLIKSLIAHCDRLSPVAARQEFLRKLGGLLSVDVKALEQDNLFYLLEQSEAAALTKLVVDLQLHTHRHHIGENDLAVFEQELSENITAIAPVSQTPLVHFCYPSGFYTAKHKEYLAQRGICSATTCEAGLNGSNCDLLSLNRFLDGQNISAIEFEAELYGFAQLMRIIKGRLRGD